MPPITGDALWGGEAIPTGVLFVRLVVAFSLGVAVALIYYATHRRDETYQPSFIATLVLLTILIALVTQVIGDNVARAFSLVGALSIVRFRTVVQDTRDTSFVIFGVVLGMAVGGGHLKIAIFGLVVAGAAAFVVGPRRARPRDRAEWDLMIRCGLGFEPVVPEAVAREMVSSVQPMGSATARQGAAVEATYRVKLASGVTPTSLIQALNRSEGIQAAEVRRASS